MGICRIDPRFGLALVLLSAVCVAGTRKAEPGQKGGQTQGGQAQTPPQGPPPRPTPSKPPNRPQPGHTRYYRRNLGYINRGRRPIFVVGGYIPLGDRSYFQPVPSYLAIWLRRNQDVRWGISTGSGDVRSDLFCDPEPGQPVGLAWQRLFWWPARQRRSRILSVGNFEDSSKGDSNGRSI
jgi:hypothetical protein